MNSIVDTLQNTSGLSYLAKNKREAASVGFQLAKVTNIVDPENLNRIKCKLLTVEGDEDVKESDWLPVITPFGGGEYGAFFVPNKDDVVALIYLEGNINRPYVIGRVWTSITKPPYTVSDGKNITYSIKTPQKSELKFSDEPQKEKVDLNTPTQAGLHIDDENKLLRLTDDKGENILTLNWSDGTVELDAKSKITLKTGSSSLEMDSSGNITIKGGKLSVEGTSITIKASADLTQQCAKGELQASGPLTIKGALVSIN